MSPGSVVGQIQNSDEILEILLNEAEEGGASMESITATAPELVTLALGIPEEDTNNTDTDRAAHRIQIQRDSQADRATDTQTGTYREADRQR